MRVLLLVRRLPTLEPWEPGRVAEGLARGLVDQGHEVHTLSLGMREDLRRDTPGGLLHAPRHPFPVDPYTDCLGAIGEGVAGAEEALGVWEREGPFELLVVLDWVSWLPGRLLSRRFGVPMALYLLGCHAGKGGSPDPGEDAYISEMEQAACGEASWVFVPGPSVGEELVLHYQVPPERIRILPPSVDDVPFRAEVDLEEFRSLFAASREPLLLYPGPLDPSAGADLIPDLVKDLGRARPDCRWVIAGQGPLSGDVGKRLGEVDPAGRARLLGAVGPLVLGALYRAADLLVLPARYEAAALAAREGFLFGLPVLAGAAARSALLDLKGGPFDDLIHDPGKDWAAAAARLLGGWKRRAPVTHPVVGRKWSETASAMLRAIKDASALSPRRGS